MTGKPFCAAALTDFLSVRAALDFRAIFSNFKEAYMLTPSRIKNTFSNIISSAEADRKQFVNNPGKDMIRNRKCRFSDTIQVTLGLESHSLNKELSSYFGLSPETIPSKSAFVQQRSKLNDKIYPHLFKQFNHAFLCSKRYMGFHLVSCDGTDVNLPRDKNDNTYFVDYASKEDGYYQLHLNALQHIGENRFLDVVIQPRPLMDEQAAFCTMIDRCDLDDKTIFIADRGYPSFNVLAHVVENKKYFLIRAKNPEGPGSFLKHCELPKEGLYDKDVTLCLTRSHRTEFKKNPKNYRILHTKRKFDYIAPDDKESIYTLKFRVVCIKIDTGAYEYLLTNLPRSTFPSEELKILYSLRWSIETSFRHLKYALGLVYFHSVKRSFIIQEVYARIIIYNFTSLLTKCVPHKPNEAKERKWCYKISFEDAVYIAKSYLQHKLSNKKIIALLLRHMSQIRPNQHMPRKVRSQSVKSLNNRT